MKTEIISIGSELTSGQNLDTNSQWLSRRLAEVGIPVGWHTTIADDFDDNVAAFRVATQRAGLVLATGGLGREASRPDAPRPRAGGGHHGVGRHHLVAHPGTRGQRGGGSGTDRAGRAHHPRAAWRFGVWRGRGGTSGRRPSPARREAPDA